MKSVKENVLIYVKEKYGTLPDYPWQDAPDNAVLRLSYTLTAKKIKSKRGCDK